MLIDALRDCTAVAVAERPELLDHFDRWLRPNTPLVLRRMGVHAQILRTDRDATAKARMLLKHELLFDVACHHEVFALIESIGRDVADAVVEEMIERARAQGAASDGSGYEEFLLAEWLARQTDQVSARLYWDELSKAHPEWQVRDHPDFLGWHESGVIETVDLMPGDQFHDLVTESPQAALEALLSLVDEDPFSPNSRSSAMQTLKVAVRAQPEDGFDLLAVISSGGDFEQSVLDGWSLASLTDAQARSICEALAVRVAAQNARSIAQLLKSGASAEPGYPWHSLPEARSLARTVWRAAADPSLAYAGGGDPLTDSINDVGGFMAEFWTQAVQHDWRASEQWTGLTPELREPIDQLLKSDGRTGTLARVFLVSQLHFWHGADRPWCLQEVLPLLNWADPDRARTMWTGFLSWGRWSNQLLEDGLLGLYLDAATNKVPIERQEDRLALHLASIAVHADVDPRWITGLARVADATTRGRWAEFVGRDLQDLEPARRDGLWTSWIEAYWVARVAGRPRRLASAEGTAMASWAMHMENHRREALRLAAKSNASLDQSAFVLDGFSRERVADAPDESAALFEVLLRAAKRPLYNQGRVREVFDMFKGTSVDLDPLREAALHADCRDAASW